MALSLVVLLMALVLVGPALASARTLDSVVCIPTAMASLEETEGRHSCAYDSPLGYRAVGVGYNLDDRSKEREREVAAVFSDYDMVYRGEECLNDVQINTLLTLDTRRAMNKAADRIPSFHDWCCNAQAVFTNIAFSRGQKEVGADFDKCIQSAEHRDWKEAAKNLRDSNFCGKHKRVCATLAAQLENGCSSSTLSLGEKIADLIF